MNFIRTRILGRAPVEGGSEPPRQEMVDVEAQTRFTTTRSTLQSLFARRLSWGTHRQISDENGTNGNARKSPTLSRFRFSLLGRPGTQNVPEERVQDGESPSQQRLSTGSQRLPVLARPPPARTHEVRTQGAQSDRHVRRSRFGGSGPAELRLLAENRGRQRAPHQSSSREHRREEPPKKFLFCFPWVKSRQTRELILRCFVLGLFLISMLTLYLFLSLAEHINAIEFSVLMILLIVLTTVTFCHSLVLLCLRLVRPRNRPSRPSMAERLDRLYHYPGYVIPREPVRVLLTRDEDAAGLPSATVRMQPPAYGVWRESVRVDPNRIYWQRARSPPPNDDYYEEAIHRRTQRRPPSYASEDGIEYAVDARPRSIAPPSSPIYSEGSTIDPPMISRDAPQLPRPSMVEVTGPRVVGRPGNWSIV
ncbi:hypothetical protein F5Y03DRAFT_143142 [Xylaria venustula]|nr:hypothetical protein F5Y03DRAFT_143142 [Xylaria venustula]